MRFVWDEWCTLFQQSAEALAQATGFYPAAIAHGPEGLTVDERALTDLMSAPSEPDLGALFSLFEEYLDEGEIGAAAQLVPALAGTRPIDVLQAELSTRRGALETELNQQRARLVARLRQVAQLSGHSGDTQDEEAIPERIKRLEGAGRLGPALRELHARVDELEVELGQLLGNLRGRIATLQATHRDAPGPKDSTAGREIERASDYLEREEYLLATRAIQRGELVQQGGLEPESESGADAQPVTLRPAFPHALSAEQIQQWLRAPASHGGTPQMQEFLESWAPDDWRSGSTADDDPRAKMVSLLAAEPATADPLSRSNQQDRWRPFLQDFFSLLGLEGLGPRPDTAKALHFANVERGRVGFWIARCSRDLSIPSTFIDPSRTSNGLLLLLWHRPLQGRGLSGAALAAALAGEGVGSEPCVVICLEALTPEKRDDIRANVRNAAVLDQRDLLRIIFAPSGAGSAAEEKRQRAEHFASAVTRQLPVGQASPFRQTGSVSSAMFDGRREIIDEFLDPAGPTILYGGRRLGKTSLLLELRRQFEGMRPGRNVAIYLDVAGAGLTSDSVRTQFMQHVIEELRTPSRPVRWFADMTEKIQGGFQSLLQPVRDVDGFIAQLRRLLSALPEHRFLLLIDEADQLLDYLNVPLSAEAATLNDPTRQLGWRLRGLVAESGGRFDIRFAGFQEIHRAASSSNGPFYNFRPGGRPARALTVFHKIEARRLATYPLRLLGVDFESEDLVERILDFTGLHPALIQDCCNELYERVRHTAPDPPWSKQETAWTIRASDVDNVVRDKAFRSRVFDAIHLNVARETRPQKILRLILYLWIRGLMAPREDDRPHDVQTSGDLYRLLQNRYPGEVAAVVQPPEVDSYLDDLRVLGVLQRGPSGYALAYPNFATLLYDDHFGGQLDDGIIDDLWREIREHDERPSRLWIALSGGHALSPLERDDQLRIGQSSDRIALLLGPPQTGKTSLVDSLRSAPLSDAQAMDVKLVPGEGMRDLRRRLGQTLNVRFETWEVLSKGLIDFGPKAGFYPRPQLLIIDNLDRGVTDPADLLWPDGEDNLGGAAHLFEVLWRAIAASKVRDDYRLRIVISGGIGLARLLVEYGGESDAGLASLCDSLLVHRLARDELDAWLEAARIMVASPETKNQLWQITAGDLRLLTAFKHFLAQQQPDAFAQAHEVVRDHINQFSEILSERPVRLERLGWLSDALTLYDHRNLTVLTVLRNLASEQQDDPAWWTLVANEIADAELTPNAVATEARAAALLGEIERTSAAAPQSVATVRLRMDDPWFSLLTAQRAD